MKRRIFALLMASAMILSLSACKENISNETSSNEKHNGEYHFGVVSDNSYDNSNYELNAEFNEDWVVYSENEILEYNGYTADDIVLEKDVKAGDVYTEIIAYDNNSYDSVIVKSEKLEADTSVDFVALAETDKTENDAYYASVEYTDIVSEVSNRDFLGEERTCVNTSAVLDGDNVYFTTVYVETNGYLLTFDICSADEAGAEAILAAFELK